MWFGEIAHVLYGTQYEVRYLFMAASLGYVPHRPSMYFALE